MRLPEFQIDFERTISRRRLMQGGMMNAAGMLLASRLLADDQSAERAETTPGGLPEAKAQAVIQIWLAGGPTHIDTFDPKPAAGVEYTGPLSSTNSTNVSGIEIGELMPELATVADKFSLIRSFTHGQNGHETASYLTQTGRMPGRIVYPAVGAVVNAFKGVGEKSEFNPEESLIPPYVVLTNPQGRFSEAGFMGVRYKPFATGGNPNAARFAVEGIVAADLTDEQQRARRRLLEQFNTLGQSLAGDAGLAVAAASREHAYDLMLGDAGNVFKLSEEPDGLRQKYGRTTFGQSCLAARRLVEAGTKFVTINHGGWDTHKDHFTAMRRLLPDLDRGIAALLSDLADRGLLESTIVWCIGEFGRTPKVATESPWNGGRHHFGQVFSTLVAGGGFQGGQIVGESDARAESVRDRPVYPGDLIGTMYELIGINPEASLPHPRGDFIRATPGADEGMESGGRLTEII
ncbi:MAG: DUF1501 domain-containing protein [Planctomycetota bacterium]|nr:MAG: DUF1501 domain-containing protein [Planctomycetota bacterium]REJ96329.1 MAG: DUF1501 domain-containing protein [Planctomycetota bacterium]REK31293.1 MAG: DUF1501 domain-containing protein [Planctomycetota bacterium]REK37323.1 MAG: DUF1501 domain-containing protein [Planctomycetota bacterium]